MVGGSATERSDEKIGLAGIEQIRRGCDVR